MNRDLVFLVQLFAKDGSRSHVVDREAFTIGRSAEAELPIPAPSVSRLHLRLEKRESAVWIQDENSANGTYINGNKINAKEMIQLQPGDRVSLGATTDELLITLIPRPFELMGSEQQKKTLVSGMAELVRTLEEQSQEGLRREMQKQREAVQRELEQLRAKAEIERNRRIEEAEGAKELILKNGRDESERLILEAEKVLAKAEAKKLEVTLELEKLLVAGKEDVRVKAAAYAKEMESEARAAHQRALERKDALLKEAEESAKATLARAEAAAQLLTQEAEAASREKETQAKQSATQIESDARATAAKLVSEAQETAKQVEADSKIAAANSAKVAEAEAHARVQAETAEMLQKHRSEMAEQRASLEAELQQLRKVTVAEAKRSAQKEQESIVENYRATTQEFSARLAKATQELAETEERLKLAVSRTEAREAELRELEESIRSAKMDLQSWDEQIRSAKALLQSAETAEARAVEARQKRQIAEEELARFESLRSEGLAKIEAEYDARRSARIAEAESLRQKLDAEVANLRLAKLDELKDAIEGEEKRYRETKQMRALELAKELEARLMQALPPVWSELREGDARVVGALQTALRASAQQVVVGGESSVRVITQHLDSRREVREKRRKRLGQALMAAGAMTAALVVIYHKPIRDRLNQLRGVAEREALERRRAESIYTPVQTEEWRNTYTDRVLFLRGYAEAKADPTYFDQWTRRLNDLEFIRSLGLSEEEIVRFIAREVNMVKRLTVLREAIDATKVDVGVAGLRKAEEDDLKALEEIVKGTSNLKAILSLEKEFTTRFLRTVAPRSPADDGDSAPVAPVSPQ